MASFDEHLCPASIVEYFSSDVESFTCHMCSFKNSLYSRLPITVHRLHGIIVAGNSADTFSFVTIK